MVKPGEFALQLNFEHEANLFRSMRTDQVQVAASRVFLRSLYLLATELDYVSEEKILSALKFVLNVCVAEGSDTPNPEVYWTHTQNEDEIIFAGSTRALEFRIFHAQTTQVYEFERERNPESSDSSGRVFLDLKEAQHSPSNSVDEENFLTDLEFLTADADASGAFRLPLWSNMPDHIDGMVNKLLQYFKADPQKWSFWRQWFQGYLSGDPIEWILQHHVAQISDEIWDAGPEYVAREIEQIRKRMAVERAIDDFKENLTRVSFSRYGIGGNRPPEQAKNHQIAESVTLIWDTIDDLSAELEKEVPDVGQLEEILKSLQIGFGAIVKWTGRKADLTIDTAIKWGVPATGGTYIAANPEKVQALISALQEWISYLS